MFQLYEATIMRLHFSEMYKRKYIILKRFYSRNMWLFKLL